MKSLKLETYALGGILVLILITLIFVFVSGSETKTETEKVSDDLMINHWTSSKAECYILLTKNQVPVGFSCLPSSKGE